MGECNGRALNGEGGAFCSESGTINTHVYTAHSHSFSQTCQLQLPDTYIPDLRKHAWLVCPQIGATKQCLLTHSYTYYTQNVLTSCSLVDRSQSWLWWCVNFDASHLLDINKMPKVTRKPHHLKSAANANMTQWIFSWSLIVQCMLVILSEAVWQYPSIKSWTVWRKLTFETLVLIAGRNQNSWHPKKNFASFARLSNSSSRQQNASISILKGTDTN